ncbi:hypothetical protein [Inconstantimicrobium porci]|uniref:Uncharacterized protein n=1 Tax=Inconstantimicrobium porci TaxID=2652291 RepID=A0A7X2T180_9CLOT|nr:hypothetical protein [Inconstantimicrobium porci]MDD6770379.1 hypothetical protein [Inconstantimicrobium porci]MSR91319.1 hypothetical protein [Inconstantimicrobium porci]
MNPFELVNLIQSKMQNPVFARQFNNLISQLESIPGLKQEVMRIASINDERKRQRAIERLPDQAKAIVGQIFALLNS